MPLSFSATIDKEKHSRGIEGGGGGIGVSLFSGSGRNTDSSSCYSRIFQDEKIFDLHFKKMTAGGRNLKLEKAVESLCIHLFEESETPDENGRERVCLLCGEVMQTEIAEVDKLSGCMSLEEFLTVSYGPSTPVPLQSFLLPTLATNVKCRDKFVDTGHLAKTRKYTDIQRLCQQNNIPNDYAVETMRRLLKLEKGIGSKYLHVEILIDLVQDHPLLCNRVKVLKKLTKDGQSVEKYRQRLKESECELAKMRRQSLQQKKQLPEKIMMMKASTPAGKKKGHH